MRNADYLDEGFIWKQEVVLFTQQCRPGQYPAPEAVLPWTAWQLHSSAHLRQNPDPTAVSTGQHPGPHGDSPLDNILAPMVVLPWTASQTGSRVHWMASRPLHKYSPWTTSRPHGDASLDSIPAPTQVLPLDSISGPRGDAPLDGIPVPQCVHWRHLVPRTGAPLGRQPGPRSGIPLDGTPVPTWCSPGRHPSPRSTSSLPWKPHQSVSKTCSSLVW